MEDELQKLIGLEGYLIDNVAFDILGIPKDEFYKFRSSALGLVLLEQDQITPDDEIAVSAKNEFDLLCKSAPNTSRDAIKSICLASTSYELCFGVSKVEEIASIKAMSVLLSITMARSFAMGAASSNPAAKEVMRKMMLSMAALKGANVKHSKPRALKSWAEQQAKSMKGADIDIARQLAARVPEHLSGASRNPERLIYDHLRARRNPAS